MYARTRAGALIGLAACLVALPSVAEAKTKSVSMGPPPKAGKALQKLGTDVNDFFPHGVSINVGDKVKFAPAGFHTVDFPAKGSAPLPLFAPTGQKVAGSNDQAGQPFWFNGQDQLTFNPALLAGAFGKTLTYNGNKRAESGLPLAPNPKPVTVKFSKAGSYTYFCDVHPGMTGVVRVKAKGKRVPSARADKRVLNKQIARSKKTAKTLSTTKTPAQTIDVGVAGPHGEEFLAFVPGTTTVPVGTTLRFRMSPGSREVHTATTSNPPNSPEDQSTYIGQLAKSLEGASPDPRALYQSEPPGTAAATLTAAFHGNGFWNSGALDNASASPLPESNSVTFGAPGKYDFYCLIHPFMHLAVTVQ